MATTNAPSEAPASVPQSTPEAPQRKRFATYPLATHDAQAMEVRMKSRWDSLAKGFEKPTIAAKQMSWGVIQLGKAVNDMLGISTFAKIKEPQPPVTVELAVATVAEASLRRERAATISSLPNNLPPSPPPSPPTNPTSKALNDPASAPAAVLRALFLLLAVSCGLWTVCLYSGHIISPYTAPRQLSTSGEVHFGLPKEMTLTAVTPKRMPRALQQSCDEQCSESVSCDSGWDEVSVDSCGGLCFGGGCGFLCSSQCKRCCHSPSPPAPAPGACCDNTCQYAGDGECDDGGVGSEYDLCSYGTDCTDCGSRCGHSPSGGGGDGLVGDAAAAWLKTKKEALNSAKMCNGVQYGGAGPWVAFGGDNFVTLAVKSVLAADTLSEVVSFRAVVENGEGGGRIMIGTMQFAFAMLGEVISLCILLYLSLNLAFNQGKDDDPKNQWSVGQWAGYLGCLGETSAYFLPAFATAALFPVACVGFLLTAHAMYKELDLDAKGGCGNLAVILFAAAIGLTLVLPSLGFIVFLICGIPAIFPMVGLLICSLVTAVVIQVILMLPDLFLSCLSGGEENLGDILPAKTGLACVATFLACLVRCPLVYSQGIGKGYEFFFGTLGAIPVHEEVSKSGFDMFSLRFGTTDAPDVLQNTLPVVGWITLIKLCGHTLLHLAKFFRLIV